MIAMHDKGRIGFGWFGRGRGNITIQYWRLILLGGAILMLGDGTGLGDTDLSSII